MRAPDEQTALAAGRVDESGPRGCQADGLWKPLPEEIAVGGGQALFLDGVSAGVTRGEPSLWLGEERRPVMGWGAAPPGQRGTGAYWWALLRLEPALFGRAETVSLPLAIAPRGKGRRELGALHLRAQLPGLDAIGGRGGWGSGGEGFGHARGGRSEGGGSSGVEAGRLGGGGVGGEGPRVAICMATYRPDPELFQRQIDSIRSQTHRSWICLISDDGSGTRGLEAIERAIGGDERFVVVPADRNRGIYRNFERALQLVPTAVDYIALADQDDEWYPQKLAELIAGIEPEAKLVYSDTRIVGSGGEVLSDTYWAYRDNNHTDYGSLVVANTVTGAASMFRRELLKDVLPFPVRHGPLFHDHWIAQVAMTLGPISYVDRPLYDYVQHTDAALGHLLANAGGRFSGSPWSRSRQTLRLLRGRGYHLGLRVPYFRLYCRVALAASVLEMRCGKRAEDGKLALLRDLQEPAAAARWLGRRVAAERLRTTETLGRERLMLGALGWEWALRTRRRLARG